MWFTENPWPPILIVSGVASLMFAAWHSTRRSIYLVIALLLLVSCGGIWFVERTIVTERERVEEAVRGITAAYSRKDLDGTLAHVSSTPRAAWIGALAAWAINVYGIESDLRISDVQITMRAENTLAEAHFRANATVSSRQDNYRSHQPSRWMTEWRLEEGEWRMTHLQPLDVVSGEPVDLRGLFSRHRR